MGAAPESVIVGSHKSALQRPKVIEDVR
jgi:hypothetical protein